MTRQSSLFDADQTPRPASWRAPTAGEKPCGTCGAAACYAEGNAHWCFRCVPAGFLPHTRGGR